MRCDVWAAQWEGPLGQWLRGQLDARGIDAPAYGRYVLSLLTRPLRPADLSPDTIQGGKTWERKNRYKGGPVKIEALKRAAAVQCLTNASEEQSSGIEQLVDELCTKIKEVEETGGGRKEKATQAARARRERRRTLSPREMARQYYAAFPALGASGTEPPALAPAPAPAPPSGKENRSRPAPRKPRRARRLPAWVTHPHSWDMDARDPLQSAALDEGYGTCDNTVTDDLLGSKRLYERDSDSSLQAENDDVIFCKFWVIEDDLCPPPKSRDEEESIAKFEAKFDRSLEALWPKRRSATPEDEYHELPVDFQDLLSSPSDRMFDCCSSPDKRLPVSLTGSIWSNNDINFECENREPAPRSEDYQPGAFVSDSGFNYLPKNSTNPWQHETESYNTESMELIYNKLQPLNLEDSENNVCAVNLNNFGFKDDAEFVTPPAHLPERVAIDQPFSLQYNEVLRKLEAVPTPTTAVLSLTALNHNPLYSSFTEVIPKSTAGYVGDSIRRRNHDRYRVDIPDTMKRNPSTERDDEDLLTSMRTHFKPIKKETTGNSHALVDYADGVTFPITSELDDVKFSRSSTGTIFLESDTDPPKQYMEYRKQGIDYSRLDICPSAACSDDELSSTELVLKFKVCQTAKYVQTDTLGIKEGICAKEMDNNLKSCLSHSSIVSLDNSICTDDKFGPLLDTDSELESLQLNWIQCEECKSNSNPWVTDPAGEHPFGYISNKIWSLDDSFCKACARLQAEEKAKRSNSKKALVYREEAAREWEELLSDISYMHSLQVDNLQTDSRTPSDVYDIGPREETVRAADGDFVRSALGQHGAVGGILDRSLSLFEGRGDRKRRHSAGGAGGAGKLRCPLPAPPVHPPPPKPRPLLLACDRPLTR